jgi:hypothetical protein
VGVRVLLAVLLETVLLAVQVAQVALLSLHPMQGRSTI